MYQECPGLGPGSCSRGDSQEYIDAIERMEPEVKDLASRIVDNLNIVISPPDDEA